MLYVIVSLIIALGGLSTYLLAPKVGPNRWFGFRLRCTMKNEETWKKSNKFAGKLMTLQGICLAAFAYLLSPEDMLYIAALVVSFIVVLTPSIIKARRIAEETKIEDVEFEF